MVQTSPMNWILILISSIALFILMNYFLETNLNSWSNKQLPLELKMKNWKW